MAIRQHAQHLLVQGRLTNAAHAVFAASLRSIVALDHSRFDGWPLYT